MTFLSHSHFDHCGNPSTFPASTKLVVGPGTQSDCRPGYPLNPNATGPESDFLGRELVEIQFPEHSPTINGMKSYDYFGDGSFYLLDAPGVCPCSLN
jgi:glyoxylase-like metal-dependent hydrolase (beta-lactamase superfamily II)